MPYTANAIFKSGENISAPSAPTEGEADSSTSATSPSPNSSPSTAASPVTPDKSTDGIVNTVSTEAPTVNKSMHLADWTPWLLGGGAILIIILTALLILTLKKKRK